MRVSPLAALLASTMILSAPAFGQTTTTAPSPPSATPPPAASPAPVPSPAAPAAVPSGMPAGSVTRDQYIQRAQERAGHAAAARFDQMDANHDGILTPDETRTYRAAHPRRSSRED
jgi:hypothetical protein